MPVEHAPPQPSIPAMLWRGFWRRCPLCGSGGCFTTWFEVRDRCPTCNFPIRREEGHWIGAVGINTVVSFGLLLLTLGATIALTWDDRRAAVILIPSFAVAAIVPVAFFGSSQTVWSAIDLAMRPLEPGDQVDPRFIPAPRRRPRR